MSRPNYLSTYRSGLRVMRRQAKQTSWSAEDKALSHRRFRQATRQALHRGEEPPTRLGFGWYWYW